MRTLAFAVAAASLLSPVFALAEDGQAIRQPVEVIAARNPDQMVCAYLYHDGGLIRRPVCHTAQFWVNEHTRMRREILDYQLRKLEPGR